MRQMISYPSDKLESTTCAIGCSGYFQYTQATKDDIVVIYIAVMSKLLNLVKVVVNASSDLLS